MSDYKYLNEELDILNEKFKDVYKKVKENKISVKSIYKITLVGDPRVGKSNLLNRYIRQCFDPPPTRIRTDLQTKIVKIPGTNERARFVFWDMFNTYMRQVIRMEPHFKDTSGVMLIFDITRRETFDNLTYWQGEIKKHVNNAVPGILVGNKMDLLDLRVVSTKEGQEYADKIGYAYIETSAKTNNNVTEAFNLMIQEVLFPGKAKI